MEQVLHFGFKWQLTKSQMDELSEYCTQLDGYITEEIRICPNGHPATKGKYCPECGAGLKIDKLKKLDPEYYWWLRFDEQCFYSNNINTVYLSLESGFAEVTNEFLSQLTLPVDSDECNLLNKYAKAKLCVFLVPAIYRMEEDDDEED